MNVHDVSFHQFITVIYLLKQCNHMVSVTY